MHRSIDVLRVALTSGGMYSVEGEKSRFIVQVARQPRYQERDPEWLDRAQGRVYE